MFNETMLPSKSWRDACAVALAFIVAGCAGSSPADHGLHPVQGKVIRKGGQPFPGGAIELRPVDNSAGAATGEIKPDGTFTLSSVVGDEVMPGAKPGQYRVTVVPPMAEDQSTTPPLTLKRLYTIEPSSNSLTIQVD